MSKIKYIILIPVIMLSGCNQVKNIFPDTKKEVKLEGERINVSRVETALTIDSSLANETATLPIEETNYDWIVSNLNPNLLPQNISLPKELKLKEVKLDKNLQKAFEQNRFIIVDENVYVICKDQIQSYNINNLHKPIWSKKLYSEFNYKNFIGGGLIFNDNKIIVAAGGREIIAINSSDGSESWRYKLSNISRSIPTIEDDKLFVITVDNRVYALSVNDGKLIWVNEGSPSEDIGSVGTASIATSNGIVIIPHSSGQLHALRSSNGEEIWSVNLSYSKNNLSSFAFTDIDLTPLIFQDQIFVYSNIGVLYSIDLISGNPNWQEDIKNVKSMWFAGEFLYLINDSNELIALNIKNSGIKWIKNLEEHLKLNAKKESKIKSAFYGPIIAGSNLIISSNQNKLLFISNNDGNIIDEKTINDVSSSWPMIVRDKIYLPGKTKLSILE